MQTKTTRRSNRERTETTRAELIAAARRLFIEKGYAETATPDIVAEAGLTRGALYHHFPDKKALFQAVVEREAEAVEKEIEDASPETLGSRDALVKGGEAFLAAMAQPGRTRLLLLDGPAVLGRTEMDAIDDRHATRSLKAGLVFAVRSGDLSKQLPIDALTRLLSSAFDRAALAIDAGAEPAGYKAGLAALIDGVLALE
ncbi:TetR/AcrR family transcriptional regulator [Mesorhizobium sp. L-8-3]|uniref:TetR/AcrR family transcriptional regulator n=1 Tax=Mesorhizobium sp. L-8-3 TaxID=2744522 RepID=UPI0019292D94|nr:TetR/AcrR family transcriptional regulator [Mesorhizobium sp. L-8-3]BCH23679.1 TetR family transcriptional regulator [Mesorhizobium sp. L-8-3]